MKKLIIGNWKMNLSQNEIFNYAKEFEVLSKITPLSVNYGFAIPSIYLMHAKDAFKILPKAIIAAQNFYAKEKGAFTGEISYAQLQDVGINYSLVGHSERRIIFHETDEEINEKVNTLLAKDMVPVLCIGETQTERDAQKHFETVKKQLKINLNNVSLEQVTQVVIAYEPVWAIGTGKSSSSTDAEDMCAFIRQTLTSMYNEAVANQVYILYGGSVNESNVSQYLQMPNINGALVGGASLFAKDFVNLLKGASNE